MEDEDIDLAVAYQEAVAKGNELRRTLNAVLRNRKRVPPHKMYKFEALVAKIRGKIEYHSELIAQLEASIIAEGGEVVPRA